MADLKINKDLWLDSATSFPYTRLEYIESNGNQYINTLYVPGNGTTKIKGKIMHNEDSIDSPVFGCRQNNGAKAYVLWSHTSANPSYQTVTGIYNSNQMTTLTPYPKNTIIEFEYGNYYLKYGDRSYNGSKVGESYPGYYMMLFTVNTNGTIDSRRFSGRMYYFQVYENGRTVRDFIPAKRNSDNAIGMYDAASGKFFANSGSGNFTAGPEIGSMPICDRDPQVGSVEGNLRLVGWGVSDTVGIPATTWANRGLNSGTIIFDDRYVYTTNGKNLYTKIAGYYFICWQYRTDNVSSSQGVGIRLNSETMGDGKLWTWGGGVPSPSRTMLDGFEGIQLAADTMISTVIYMDASGTQHPMNVWVFVVENGA